MNKSSFLPLAFVFGIAFLLRVPSFFVKYYNIDELTNCLFAQFVLDGQMTFADFLGRNHVATFYLYAFVLKWAGSYNLTAIHAVHAIWVGLTAVVLYFAGVRLTTKKVGGIIASLLYAFFSIAFFSKDYQAAISESFSLLPATMAALLFLKWLDQEKDIFIFWSGFFIGFSFLFKAPSGILLLPLALGLFLSSRRWFPLLFLNGFGFFVAVFIPFLLAGNFLESFHLAHEHLFRTQEMYIRAYDHLSFGYWFSKYLVRTFLVLMAALPLWYFAFLTLKQNFFSDEQEQKKIRIAIFFLFLWLVCDWLVVALGKRVFFHYFVFLFPSLCLLAAPSILALNEMGKHWSLSFRHKVLWLVSVLSFLTFFSDGIFRWSLKQKEFPKAIEVIRNQTSVHDSIYIWGLIPQLYFFSERKPASTMIWADTLAGFSPGSAAMEYMRVTGKNLTIGQSLQQDLAPLPEMNRDPNHVVGKGSLWEKELLTFSEILERISHPLWKKLFEDFAKKPPTLILDTAPTGVRGFSHYPLEKFDLLKKFVDDNYDRIGIVDGIIFYRLRGIRHR